MNACRATLAAVFFLLISGVVLADSGHIWLSAQIQADGRITEAGNPQATSWQAASEAATALHNAGMTSSSLTATRTYLLSLDPDSTELLSRQIIAGRQAGSDVTARVDALLESQNPDDGGFGHLALWQSTPLDTAYAVQALAAAGKARETATGYAVQFLLSGQRADGSWAAYDTNHPAYVTALALRALHDVRTTYAVSGAITQARDWLLAHRDANGLWRDRATSAMVLAALTPTFTDATPLDPAFGTLTVGMAVSTSPNQCHP